MSPRVVIVSSRRRNNKAQKRQPRRGNNNNNGQINQQYNIESNIVRLPKPTVCHIGRQSGPFPDEYYNTMKIDTSSTFGGAATVSNTYIINGSANLFGPQTNYAGAFAANYPAGIDWLLGSRVVTGSTSPYTYQTTLYYRFEIQITNNGSVPIDFFVFPSVDPSFLGMSVSNLTEQRGAVRLAVPATQIGGPYRIRLEGRVAQLLGVKESEVQNDFNNYGQAVGAIPTNPCYMHMVCASKDNSTSVSTYVVCTVYLDMKFSNLNPMGTTGPTLSTTSSTSSTSTSTEEVNPTAHRWF